jgi:hypothetical protein
MSHEASVGNEEHHSGAIEARPGAVKSRLQAVDVHHGASHEATPCSNRGLTHAIMQAPLEALKAAWSLGLVPPGALEPSLMPLGLALELWRLSGAVEALLVHCM